jgi:outer membrane protein insertion porin family
VQYWRVGAEGRYYYPITEKITFVTSAMGGHIGSWGGDDIRLIDLFYKGGETIRGFNRGGFGPRDLLTRDALGGSTFWAVTTEVRFPLPFVPDDLGMSGAVFADAGSLFGAGAGAKKFDGHCGEQPTPNPNGTYSFTGICLADSSSVRASAGVSLLWNSPMGPLRLDIAKALVKESYDTEQLIRFGASTRF